MYFTNNPLPTHLTALITGASEGLGKAFAFELARRKMNLVLVSLPHTGLCSLARLIRNNFGVAVETIEVDLSDLSQCAHVFQQLQSLQLRIHLLINNAGMGNWASFLERNVSFYKTQIDLNIHATVQLSHLFLEQLVPDEPAYLLNVGSLGGQFVVPGKIVYGATKCFIRFFTQGLQSENELPELKISLLSPGGINTKPELLIRNHLLSGFSAATILEPELVARIAINGLFKGKKEIVPGFLNRVLLLLNLLLPTGIKSFLTRKNLKTNLQSEI